MSESVTMTTKLSDYQCSNQHLPQLPEFNDTEWIETAIENSDLELMSSLLYAMLCTTFVITSVIDSENKSIVK